MKEEFYKSLEPIFNEDDNDFKELQKREILSREQVIWYGASRFDIETLSLFERSSNRIVPKEIKDELKGEKLYIMSDYSKSFLNGMKKIYDDFDKDNFNINNGYLTYGQVSGNINILEMIPFSIFSSNELESIRNEKGKLSYHSSATDSVITDDKWHLCYMHIEYENKDMHLLLSFMENVVFLNNILDKFNFGIKLKILRNVIGKCGSWEDAYSPKSFLFRAINTLPVKNQPKYWFVDNGTDFVKQLNWQILGYKDESYLNGNGVFLKSINDYTDVFKAFETPNINNYKYINFESNTYYKKLSQQPPEHRRKRVQELLNRGLSQVKIAEYLHIPEKTIFNDVRLIKENRL